MHFKIKKSLIVFLCLFVTVLLLILPLATRVRVSEKKEYFSAERVALYLYEYGHLPSNFLTKEEAKERYGSAAQCIADGYNVGGDVFSAELREDYADWIGNYSQKKEFFECDIYPDRDACIAKNTRGEVRLVYSADCEEVYFTDNHYGQFETPGFTLLKKFSLNALSNGLWIAFGAVCVAQVLFLAAAYIAKCFGKSALWYGTGEAIGDFFAFCFELIVIPVCLVAYPVHILLQKHKKRRERRKGSEEEEK